MLRPLKFSGILQFEGGGIFQLSAWDRTCCSFCFLFPCPSRPPTFPFFLCSMSIRGLFCALPRGYPRMGMSSDHQSQCWLGQSRVRAMTVWVPKPLKPSPIWGRGSCYGNLPLPKFHSVKLSLRLLLAINHAPSETQHQIAFACVWRGLISQSQF